MVDFPKPQRLGQMLGLGDNPFYQAFDANRNAFTSAFSNMGADPLNPWAGWGQGFQRGSLVDAAQAQQAQEQAQLNQTTEWLKQNYPQFAGLPPAEGFQAAMKLMGQNSTPGSNLMSVGGHLYDTESGAWISPPQTDNRQNISLAGQWGRDEQGNPVFLQPSSTGEMIPAQVPEGVTLMGPFDTSADRAAGSAFGKGTGTAQFDLPGAQLMADQTLKAIEDVRSNRAGMDEQFGTVAGVIPQQMTPAWPGSAKANFQVAANRLTSRAFLEARQMLRGGGQITDFESRKAETAITNIEDAMARGDKALFEQALNDFEQAVRDGLAKLQQQAGAMPGYGSSPQPQQNVPGPSGRVLTFNPATGRLE